MTVTVLMTTALCALTIAVLAFFSASILREQSALRPVKVRSDEHRLRTHRVKR